MSNIHADNLRELGSSKTSQLYSQRKKLNEAAVEIEHLSAIVEKLPKTGDNVPVVPGMVVYCLTGCSIDERTIIGPYGNFAVLTKEPSGPGWSGGHAHRLTNTIYSTREAALAAKEGEDG